MTTAISFRKPSMTTLLSPVYGIPLGTHGRGAQIPRAIILHYLTLTLESYDAQVFHPERLNYRDRAQPRHPSLHYAIGYNGEIHNYVNDLDIAHGMWDYQMSAFPTPFPEGAWSFLTTYPDVTPDYYALHIAATSGINGNVSPFSLAELKSHARLVAWLCHTYSITCNTTNVVMHGAVDLQFAGICKDDEYYPYAEILAAAQAIITAGGETDPIYDPPPIIEELYGPFTVSVSRVSSAAYVSNDT